MATYEYSVGCRVSLTSRMVQANVLTELHYNVLTNREAEIQQHIVFVYGQVEYGYMSVGNRSILIEIFDNGLEPIGGSASIIKSTLLEA